VVRLLTVVAVATAVAAATPARAETYRLSAPDGTVHFTNAPTDPRYQRMVFSSGTSAGWLRLPPAALGSAPYLREIKAAAERYGISERLVSAVIRVESGFNSRAVSRKGARGLMQLMPATAAELGVQNTFDPAQNIEGGVRHLRGLIDRFGNNVPLALAAYNAGERAVLSFGGIPPYPETQDYVTRVLRLFDGEMGVSFPGATYRVIEADGTIVYTNIPPRGRK
jgi:soluble lytic murein transglycosylase-like protein